jgi:hypothetical protein
MQGVKVDWLAFIRKCELSLFESSQLHIYLGAELRSCSVSYVGVHRECVPVRVKSWLVNWGAELEDG